MKQARSPNASGEKALTLFPSRRPLENDPVLVNTRAFIVIYLLKLPTTGLLGRLTSRPLPHDFRFARYSATSPKFHPFWQPAFIDESQVKRMLVGARSGKRP